MNVVKKAPELAILLNLLAKFLDQAVKELRQEYVDQPLQPESKAPHVESRAKEHDVNCLAG
jgi:hypothetical protein